MQPSDVIATMQGAANTHSAVKVIGTIGLESRSVKVLEQLLVAGMTVRALPRIHRLFDDTFVKEYCCTESLDAEDIKILFVSCAVAGLYLL